MRLNNAIDSGEHRRENPGGGHNHPWSQTWRAHWATVSPAPQHAQHQCAWQDRSRPNIDRSRILYCSGVSPERTMRTMSTSPVPNIECEQHHNGIVVSDLDDAIESDPKKLRLYVAFE